MFNIFIRNTGRNMPRGLLLLLVVVVVLVIVLVVRSPSQEERIGAAKHILENLPQILATRLTTDLETLLEPVKWDYMVEQLVLLFESIDQETQRVPRVVATIDVKAERDRVLRSANNTFVDLTEKIDSHGTDSDDKAALLTNRGVHTLRTELLGLVKGLPGDESCMAIFDQWVHQEHTHVTAKVKERLSTVLQTRVDRVTDVYRNALDWDLVVYMEFLRHAVRIRTELNTHANLQTWAQTQSQHVLLQYGTEDMEPVHRFFEAKLPAMDSILAGQTSAVYVSRTVAVQNDLYLNKQQKRNLLAFAKARLDQVTMEEEEEEEEKTTVYTLADVQQYYEPYMARIAREKEVILYVADVEYDMIRYRATAQGRMACIIQFYSLRTSVNDAFLYEFCKARDYDLSVTRADFTSMTHDLVSDPELPTKLLELTPTSYLTFMYEETKAFLQERARLFLADDDILREYMLKHLEELHTQNKDLVSRSIMTGVQEELEEDSTATKAIMHTVLERFLATMEHYMAVASINARRDEIIGVITSRAFEIQSEIEQELYDAYVAEALQPFTFEAMEKMTHEFVQEGDTIDYVGLKTKVVADTNAHAIQVLQETRTSYTEAIDTVFRSLDTLVETMAETTERLDVAEYVAVQIEQLKAFSNTVESTSLVTLESLLGQAFDSLEPTQDQRLRNFFNTKIQTIKDQLQEQVVAEVQDAFSLQQEHILQQRKELSLTARRVFRELVDEYFAIEQQYRGSMYTTVGPVLEAMVEDILADYDIVSFGKRETILRAEMKNAVNEAVRGTMVERIIALNQFHRKYETARSEFRDGFYLMGTTVKAEFRSVLRGIAARTRERSAQIIGYVADLLQVVETTMFEAMSNTHEDMVDIALSTEDNNLPESLSLESMTVAPGQLIHETLGDKDAVVLPYEAFGSGEVETDQPSGLTTEAINTLLLDWDTWFSNKTNDIIQEIIDSMTEDLTQNTCRDNKPPCRDGWIQDKNLWGVDCCVFNPEAQGRPPAEIAFLLGKEIALAMFLDLENIAGAAGKVIQVAEMAATKAKKVGQKTLVKCFQKYGGKSPTRMTKAIGLARKFGAQKAAKMGKRVGASIVGKAAKKVAVKGAATGAKMLTKLSLGPAGIALMIFDTVSLVLDLWDPAGYNESQTAGMLRVERDQLEMQWSSLLTDSGLHHPLLADPMYMYSPEQQNNLMLELGMEWLSDKTSEYLTANEARHGAMPETEVAQEIEDKETELIEAYNADTNILFGLLVQRLDDVVLRDVSVRESYANPYTDGGPDSDRKHLLRHKEKTGIQELVLDEVGCRKFNAFHAKKALFLDSFKFNRFFRYIKREHNYMLTKATGVAAVLTVGSRCFPTPDRKVYEPSDSMWKSGEYVFIPGETCMGPELPLIYPTIERSQEIGQWLLDNKEHEYNSLGAEIMNNTQEGWVFVEVNAEEEFWVQYSSDKSVLQLLDRRRYQEVHERITGENRLQYTQLVDTVCAADIEFNTPETEDPVRFADVKIVALASVPENWEGDTFKYPLGGDSSATITQEVYTIQTLPSVPEWVPTYTELVELYEPLLEEAFATQHAQNLIDIRQAMDDADTVEQDRLQAKADEEGLTVDEVRDQEAKQGRTTMPTPPDFAVFRHGFAQISPLYSIKNECEALGRGVEFDQDKGLCNFTPEYCNRYGTDHFFNKDLGVYDCELPRGLFVAEYVFGTTISRSVYRGIKAAA
ncbi:FirrV-1-D1 precursor [Feldmannia irregularis virus a]|uniref:FirrV-1-D1 n=1 Tax=Feldmannia irregularis virus a TaxID=231992 RepID=Q6XLW8_9PHYC|nr:FirrV-1-D1 precursor [Feldmannia irregularis virus a]AAR26943.1 FirrV-1-D1 precursor [Feldmannia irregularis virus a]